MSIKTAINKSIMDNKNNLPSTSMAFLLTAAILLPIVSTITIDDKVIYQGTQHNLHLFTGIKQIKLFATDVFTYACVHKKTYTYFIDIGSVIFHF